MIQLKLLKILVITAAIYILSFLGALNQSAQSKPPARTSHVNDFAGVIDVATRTRLENILENLQRKTGVQFDLATVQSTTGREIFAFSQELARNWDVGARSSAKKSLLLVVSVDDRTSFTQYSKSVQADLPEGILGDVGTRMRAMLSTGHVNDGIKEAVERFVTALGRKMAFRLEDLEQETALVPVPQSTQEPTTAPASNSTVVDNLTPVVMKSSGETRQRVVTAAPSPTPQGVASNLNANSNPRLSVDDEDELEEVEVTLALPLVERISTLKEFIAQHPKSKAIPRARELLVSAHAALGDSLLRVRDSAGGIEQLMMAIDEAPLDASEKLFAGVVAQIPMNLYLREERVAAFAAAQKIEEKFGNEAQRLLALADFYLGIERGDDAARLASKAVNLNPELAEAHYSLGVAMHISLRLDEAVAEYRRAIELDNKFNAARRRLADLNRAAGKADEALTYYREQVAADPKDKAARAGLILSLLDLSRKDEADQELDAALKDDPKNVTLLSGAAYWFAAHNETKRALDLARQAVEQEPRYTWSQIALARALIGEKRPLEGERALRFAQQYGKFPTLDYELANLLGSVGLYEEAAEVLARSFSLTDGELEARLAGRITRRSDNFIDLLAPERQASLFQVTAADTADNAKILKALLAFTLAANNTEDEQALITAAKAFASGDDKMRGYRQMYVASRLLRLNKGLDVARDLVEAARSAVDDAMETPAVTVAAQADELREYRSRAIASGLAPEVPDAPRDVLANIIRGRIEDLSGWVLFNQDKYTEAAEALQRAARILPEGTPSWRTAMWHLGAALEQTGMKEDALNAYIKSYLSGERSLARRALIERLYVQVNGSLDGLDQRIGPAPAVATTLSPGESTESPSPGPESSPSEVAASAQPQTTPSPATDAPKTDVPSALVVTETPQTEKPAATDPTPEPTPEEPTPSPVESSPTESPQPTPSPVESSPTESPQPTPSPVESSPTESPQPTPSPVDSSPTELPQPSPESSPAAEPRSSTPGSRPGSEPTLADLPPQQPTSLRLTGRVMDASGNPISNVVIVLISPRGSVLASTTDAEGNYSFIVSPSEKPFRLVPSKDGLVFDPIDKMLVIFTQDRSAINFTGKEQP
jgi:uncharacterized membrane protein YgcG/tetratricopeptide (TPR) repeat protein